jgi:hypothetical protein
MLKVFNKRVLFAVFFILSYFTFIASDRILKVEQQIALKKTANLYQDTYILTILNKLKETLSTYILPNWNNNYY